MIPKTIHYCWFGGKKKSNLINKCISSWKLYLPDYEIIEWNESNCDLSLDFLQSCLKLKKWAFISDYIRLKKLKEFGGIYLDTDMLLVKNLNPLLRYNCFFGAEDLEYVNASIFGVEKGFSFIDHILNEYEKIDSLTETTDLTTITIPRILTKAFNNLNNGINTTFSTIKEQHNIVIFPSKYFYPLPYNDRYKVKDYNRYIYPETYAIHLWNASWVNYSEFHYFRMGSYKKGFLKIVKGETSQKLSLKYFEKIASCIKESLKSKN